MQVHLWIWKSAATRWDGNQITKPAQPSWNLEPGPGSWPNAGVLTTSKQMMSLVTLQLLGHGRFNPGRDWQLVLESRSLA